MKITMLSTLGILIFFAASHTFAESAFVDTVEVKAIPGQSSVVTQGKDTSYSKEFNLQVINKGEGVVALNKGCFIGYDISFQVYFTESVEETLEKAELGEGQVVRGQVAFLSNNAQVQNIQLVRYQEHCN